LLEARSPSHSKKGEESIMSPQPSSALLQRADSACELCKSGEEISAFDVEPRRQGGDDDQVLLCTLCLGQCATDAALDVNHLFCLQDAAWSQTPAVQVVSYRLLSRLSDQNWAQGLLGQLYFEDGVLEWAEAGLRPHSDTIPSDSNGNPLSAGDSVTLIKDLDVKGTSFVAKRGMTVKNIRVTDDTSHIEGKVNGVSIMLKTEFLKRL
jgi:protein PhnA